MKRFVFYAVFLFFLTVVFMFIGCDSTPDVTDTPESPAAGENGYAATGGIDEKGMYTGGGGKGASITILAPEARGLGEDQNYLPELVQGEFMSNFSGYSGISVFDRMNLDKIYEEQLGTGYYDDSDRAGLDLGHLTSTDYIMNGSITKTNTGYALQIQVTKNEGKMNMASYSGTCTFAELDNLTGVRRASRDLLEKLGVSLTEKAKTELGGAAAEQAVNAQLALSKGIEAMKKGTVVEALSYFVQSQSYDPQLEEAVSRVNIVSANISSGNIGADARNDIAWRKAWVDRLVECEQWVTNYVKNTPVPAYLYYSTDVKQEDINYSRETLSISIEEITLRVDDRYDWAAPIIGVVNPVYAGLKETGRAQAWEVGGWPNNSVSRNLSALGNKTPEYDTVVELVNDKGEVIGRQSPRLRAGWWTGFGNGTATSGKNATTTGLRFTGVDANKITDRLSIRIASLNGKGAEEAAKANSVNILTRDEYWRIAGQRDLAVYKEDYDRALADYSQAIRLDPRAANAYYNRGLIYYNKKDYGPAEEDFAQAVSLGLNNAGVKKLLADSEFFHNSEFRNGVIISYKGTNKNIVIPERINGETVRAIGEYVFTDYKGGKARGLKLSSVVVPGTVTSIGYGAFVIGYTKGFLSSQDYPAGLSVSLPANISFKESTPGTNELRTEPLGRFYNENGKRAGTYTWDGKKWQYNAKR